MKTQLHYYKFNTDDPLQEQAHNRLCLELNEKGLKKFDSISSDHYTFYRDHIKPLDGQEVTLETSFLFDNQWNTAPTETSEKGLRVFDWSEAIYQNTKIKEGMWLEQTDEMKEIRRNTNVCGYCGKYEPAVEGNTFCYKCLSNPYLKESELHLTRMMPVDKGIYGGKRKILTEAEKSHLLPLYVAAQTKGRKAKAIQERENIKAKYEKHIETARIEWQGFTWLLDHDVLTDNCIYYSHTQEFCFGWRSPLSESVARKLESDLRGFPFVYDMKENGNQ